MSDSALLPTRLYWQGMRGVARLEGREVALRAKPVLPGVDLLAVDYAPGQVAIVLPRREGWREMTAGEVVAARALLEQYTQGWRPDHEKSA